jgi:hypothetical protein
MGLNRTNLIDIILDYQGKSDEKLKAALLAQLGGGEAVETKPFNHDADNLIEACGMTKRDIDSSHIRTAQEAEDSSNSEIVEALEKTYTKRELAYMVFFDGKTKDEYIMEKMGISKVQEKIELEITDKMDGLKKMLSEDPKFKAFLKKMMGEE